MSEFNKTLSELWKEAGEKPFLAEKALTEGHARIFATGGTDGKSFIVEFVYEASHTGVRYEGAREPGWRLYVEPKKLVPHLACGDDVQRQALRHWPSVRNRGRRAGRDRWRLL